MAGKVLRKISSILNRASNWSMLNELSSFSSVRMNQHLAMDPTQALLLQEQCISVDTNDKAVGNLSKEAAHLLGPDGQLPPLHRAFSVFLFNTKNELLMQQRSNHKITFPGNCMTTAK